jgi:hypothetical protein
MYRLRQRIKHHAPMYGLLLIIPVAVIIAGITLHNLMQPHTVLKQSSPVTYSVGATSAPPQRIAKSFFTFDLPAHWVAAQPPAVAYTVYSWQGAAGTEESPRRLDVYVDTIPTTLAVNRLLPVQSNVDRINLVGDVSDNCTTFTAPTEQSRAAGSAASKWNGVNFLCDVSNYERTVAATGSTENINTVTVTGPTTGAHRVLLLYTDNSGNPDYSIFTAIVRSFHAI